MKTIYLTKILFLLLISMQLAASTGTGICKAGFSWKQTGPNQITFTNTSSAAGTASGISLWSFGDATGGWVKNPTHIYNTPGRYSVCLTFTNTDSTCSSYVCYAIIVNQTSPPCNARFTWEKDSKNVFYFTNKSSGSTAATKFYWTFGDGGLAYTSNPSHTYTTPGIYRVCLEVVDSISGCKDYIYDSVVVKGASPNCAAKFRWGWSYDPLNPLNTSFLSTSNATAIGASYYWDFGDGNTATAITTNITTHNYKSVGIYRTCLKITDFTTGCTDYFCDTVNLMCHTTIYVNEDPINKNHFYVTNNLVGNAPLTYTWSWRDGTPDDHTPAPSHIYTTAGFHRICLKITNKTGCNSSSCDSLWPPLSSIFINVLPATNSVKENNILNAFNVYPNPAKDNTTITYTLSRAGKVKISVYNLLGENIIQLENNIQASGVHEKSWNTSELLQGIYLVFIVINDTQVSTQRISVTK